MPSNILFFLSFSSFCTLFFSPFSNSLELIFLIILAMFFPDWKFFSFIKSIYVLSFEFLFVIILKKLLLSPPWKKIKAKSIFLKDIDSWVQFSKILLAFIILSFSLYLLFIKDSISFCSFKISVKAPLVKYFVKSMNFLMIKLLTKQLSNLPVSKIVQTLKK